MKKRFAVLFLMILTCLTLVIFGACGGGEDSVDNNEPSTTTEGDCSTLGHDYRFDADQSRNATCTEEGLIVNVCSRCGDRQETTVGKLAHVYALDAENSTPASCKAEGLETYRCANCGDFYTVPVAKLSHVFEPDESASTAATCTKAGERVLKCEACGETTKTPIPALGHAYDGPECTERTCTRENCGMTAPAVKAHSYVDAGTREETLEGDDYLVYCHGDIYTVSICSACGARKEVLKEAAVLHKVETWSADGELRLVENETCLYEHEVYGTCELCELPIVHTEQVESHRYINKITQEATCVKDGYKQLVCSLCGDIGGELVAYQDADAHNWTEGSVLKGVTTFTCSGCSHTKTALVSSANNMQVNKDALKSAEEVNLGGASIAMDETAKEALPDEALVLGLKSTKAPENAQLDASKKFVYSITLERENASLVTSFGNGKVTVRIPYELQDGEDPESINIWYIDDNGDLTSMKATYSNGFAVFETDHFSYYTVGIMTPEEMCEAYGHRDVDNNRSATCTTNGYNITLCTRCGHITKNEFVPALGHEMVKDTEKSKDATCTAEGKLVMVCSHNCGKTTTTTLAALGHTWQKDDANSIAATCTKEGKNAYNCTVCGAKAEEEIPMAPHDCTEVVTKPTCTESGYTTFTCKDCNTVYTGNVTTPTGHTWNIPAPTCTEGQTCTVCGAKGQQATGHIWDIEEPTCTQGQTCTICGVEGKPMVPHTYGDEGYCTVCGYGCDHKFDVIEDVASTCTVAGHTTSKCSVCGQTKTEEKELLAHSYGEGGRCDVCGAVDPDRVSEYMEVLKSLYADSYTFSLSELHFTVDTGYNTETFALQNAKGVVAFEDGKMLFCVTADSATVISESSYRSDFSYVTDLEEYSDGEYVIASLTLDGERQVQRIPAEYAFGSGSSSSSSAVYAGIFKALRDEVLRNYLFKLFDQNYMTLSVLLNKVVNSVFTRTGTGDTYTLTFNRDAAVSLNDKLKNGTIVDVFEGFFGEQSFASLVGYIKEVAAMTPKAAIDDLLKKAEDYHIDKDELFEIINHVAAIVLDEIDRAEAGYGSGSASEEKEPFDINDYYNNEMLTSGTLAELLLRGQRPAPGTAVSMFNMYVDSIAATFGENSFYDYLSESSGGHIDTAMISELVGGILSDDALTFSIHVEGGKFKGVTLDIDSFSLYDAGLAFSIEIDGTLEITTGGTVEAPSTSIDDAMLAVIGRKIDVGNGSFTYPLSETESFNDSYDCMEKTVRTVLFTRENGKIVATVTETHYLSYDKIEELQDGSIGYRYTYKIGDLSSAIMSATDGCGENITIFSYSSQNSSGNTRQYFSYVLKDGKIVETDLGEADQGYYYGYGLALAFDSSANILVEASGHKFVTDASKSQTADSVKCGEYYTIVETCSQCGATREVKKYKTHTKVTEYSLVNGAKSCLEGVICTVRCSDCKAVLNTYPMELGRHYFNEVAQEVKTSYGTVVIKTYACACGQEGVSKMGYNGGYSGSGYYGSSYVNATIRLNSGETRTFSNNSFFSTDTLYSAQFIYTLYNSSSGSSGGSPSSSSSSTVFRISIDGNIKKDGCYKKVTAVAKVYVGQETVGTVRIAFVLSAEHQSTTTTTSTQTSVDNNNVTTEKTETTYACEHGVNLIEEYERRFDSTGRLIYVRSELRKQDGTILSYERKEYKWNGCSYDLSTYDAPDAQPKVETGYTGHEYIAKAELLEGAKSCEEGVRVTYICVYCGKSVAMSTVYYEHINVAEEHNVNVGSGMVTFSIPLCACGMGDFGSYISYMPVYYTDKNGTRYSMNRMSGDAGNQNTEQPTRPSDSPDEPVRPGEGGYDQDQPEFVPEATALVDEVNGNVITTYYLTGFPLIRVTVSAGDPYLDGCFTRCKVWVSIYYNGTLAYSAEQLNVVIGTQHKVETKNLTNERGGKYGEGGYLIVNETKYLCGHGSTVTETQECHTDAQGRTTYMLEQVTENGKIISYSRTECTYQGCNVTAKRYTSPDDNNPSISMSVNHRYEYQYVLIDGATNCEQGCYEADRCIYCGETAYESSYVYNRHMMNKAERSVMTADGEIVYGYETCACGENTSLLYVYHVHDGHQYPCEMNGEAWVCRFDGCTVELPSTREGGVYSNDAHCYYGTRQTLTIGQETIEFFYIERTEHTVTKQNRIYHEYKLEEDGYTGEYEKATYVYSCGHVATYTETTEVRYDAVGREIYRFHEMYAEDGSQIVYSLVETRYFEGTCNYVCLVKDDPNGDFRVDGFGTRHGELHRTYTLLGGEGSSCTDGFRVVATCPVCGEIAEDYVEHDHYTHDVREEIKKEDGTVVCVVTTRICPCGERIDYFWFDDMKCDFDYHSYDENYNHYDAERGLYVYRCAETDCNVVMTEKREVVVDGCETRTYSTFKFYEGETLIGNPDGYSSYKTTWDHKYTTRTLEYVTYTLEKDNYTGERRVTREEYPCGHLTNITRTYEVRYDKYGRTLYILESEVADRGSTYYREEKFEFLTEDGCACKHSVRYSATSSWQVGTETRHGNLVSHWIPATCTQYGHDEYVCSICGETENEWWVEPTGHYYYGGRCLHCGLETEKETDGAIVLEDMSDGEEYKVGVWARDVSAEDVEPYAYLLYLDGDEEKTIEIELDWSTVVPVAERPDSFIISVSRAAVEAAKAAIGNEEVGDGWTFVGLQVTYIPMFNNESQVITIVLTD